MNALLAKYIVDDGCAAFSALPEITGSAGDGSCSILFNFPKLFKTFVVAALATFLATSSIFAFKAMQMCACILSSCASEKTSSGTDCITELRVSCTGPGVFP